MVDSSDAQPGKASVPSASVVYGCSTQSGSSTLFSPITGSQSANINNPTNRQGTLFSRHLITVILPLCLILIAPTVFAKSWQKQYSIDYKLGDGDSKSSARQIALEQLKLKASAEAGSYIQSTTNLKNDRLSESVQILSATMVQISQQSEKVSLNPEGAMVYTLTATVTVDETELANRITAVQQDSAKSNQLKSLQRENNKLRSLLTTIQHDLASNKTKPKQVIALLKRQNDAIATMNKNESSAREVFERGTLIEMANRNQDSLQRIQKKLEQDIFERILNTPIYAHVENVLRESNGYTVLVRVGWELNHSALEKSVKDLLYTSSDSTTTRFERKEDYTPRSNLSAPLFKYLAKQKVNAIIKIGDQRKTLPVYYALRSGGSYDEDDIRYIYEMNVKSQIYFYNKILSKKSEDNPLVFHLTEAEAANAMSVNAKMERIH